ncbi:putative membrane protein [Erwinia phage Wellington]|uniref:Putative membrane protein n=1 Tax=Erwinia phage Wellington TaxID=2267653 RepID=A0A345BLJ4_9CAUD|nr:virion structural protein [Erwinia phage Wellington]AXF51315.1 putative membrane protein [Erwinia phage Wellington]
MAVVFDPHQKESGNLIPQEAVTPIGSKYRVLIPANAPFYTGSVVVTSNGKTLKFGRDYVFGHRFMTGIQRTGRNIHASIWITNEDYVNNFAVDYHAVGSGIATPAQIAAERQANADKYPVDCQWEEVIGEVYFPPVDIQFDKANWQGELELMQAIAAIGKKIAEKPALPDPYTTSSVPTTNHEGFFSRGEVVYQNDLSYLVKKKPTGPFYTITGYNSNGMGDYRLIVNFNLKSLYSQVTPPIFAMLLRNYWGSGFAGLHLRYMDGDLKLALYAGDNTYTYYPIAAAGKGLAIFNKPFTVTVINSKTHDTVSVVVTQEGQTVLNYTVDIQNPPASVSAEWTLFNVRSKLSDRTTDLRLQFDVGVNDTFSFNDFPGYGYSADDNAPVLALLKDYAEIVNELYRGAPAHDHVGDTNDPHEDTPGSIGALPLNDIAFDSALAFGRTQAALAVYINNLLPKATDLNNRILRIGNNTPVPGAFTLQPGLGQITSTSAANETAGVETIGTVDDKMIRLLSKTFQRHVTTQNASAKAGTNELVLYSDSRKLQWKGKPLLDPTTVIPYLPGVTGSGDGLFYGENTATFTINGNGIQTVPFKVQWQAPSNANRDTSALRKLTVDFGTSDDLLATPALLSKLDALFTGKLLLAKANINGMALSSSVTIDKLTFNLSAVSNTPDTLLPVSTAQQTELDKYADTTHTHTPAQLGIVAGTDKVKGLVKTGKLVDDNTAALDAAAVTPLVTRTDTLATTAGSVDSGAVIDIIRYGTPGATAIPNALTASGWMVSIKANTYFVRLRYDVPLGSFNLTQLTSSPSNKTFFVYVDVVNNAGLYRVSLTKLPESATLTEIGSFTTDDSSVLDSTISNVTRLGEFRELVEHAASKNDHSHRAMTQAEFGFTFNNKGEEWVGGMKGSLRRDADWRARGVDGWRSRENVRWGALNAAYEGLVFSAGGVNAADHLIMQCITPYYAMQDASVTFTPTDVTGNDDTLFEVMGLGFTDSRGNFNRFSVLVSRSNYISDVNGNLCHLGFAINYGSPKQIIIGASDYPVNNANTWASLLATVAVFADAATLRFTVSLPSSAVVTLNLATGVLTMGTQTIDLNSRLSAAGITLAEATNVNLKRHYGVGGSFSGLFRCRVDAPAAMSDNNVYNTLVSFVENFSGLERARYIEGVLTTEMLAMTDTQLRTAIVKANTDTHYSGIPRFISTADLILYTDKVNKRYTGVVLRD